MVDASLTESEVFENARKFHENYLLKFQENDLQEAIQNYIEVINLNPSKSECYYRLASLMLESGQITLDDAIEQCKKAIAINPENVNAYIYAGYYLEQAEDFDMAEKIFKQAIKLSGIKSARARLILASTILKRMSVKGYTMSGVFDYCHWMLSGGLFLLCDMSSIKMMYKNFVDYSRLFAFRVCGKIFEKLSLENALSFYKKAMQETQRSEYFYNKIAQIYLHNGATEHALECYKKSLIANPNSKDALIKLATLMQSFYPEKVDEIIEYYTMLLELEEDRAPIYYELGHLYLQKNDKINSVSAFKLALKGNEDNPFYNNSLGFAFVQAELFDDAIEYYQKAIKLNPDKEWTATVCHTLGLIYQKCRDNNEAAIASFQAGAVLDPTNEDILLSLGDVYSAEGDLDSAIRVYGDILTLNPENCEACSKMGIVLYDKKYTQEAITAYEKAIKLNPEHAVSYNNLGVIYLDELKDYDYAIEYFDEALKINPNYTLAYFNKARAYRELGKNEDAAKFYQIALDLNKVTHNLDEREILERIYNLFNL